MTTRLKNWLNDAGDMMLFWLLCLLCQLAKR